TPPADKPPLHIPIAIGLLDADGQSLPIRQADGSRDTLLLELRETRQTWTLTDIPRPPVLSLLRGFSAPVILETDRTADDLALLACHDPDPFARWDAVRKRPTGTCRPACRPTATAIPNRRWTTCWRSGVLH